MELTVLSEFGLNRHDEGRRKEIVMFCKRDNPEFNLLIQAALTDYDDQVVNEAVERYQECDIIQKERIVSARTLKSWFYSADFSRRIVASKLLQGRNDIEIDVIRKLFYDDDIEICRAVRDNYYQTLSSEGKKELFSLEELESQAKNSEYNNSTKAYWISLLAVFPVENAETTCIQSCIMDFLEAVEDIADILFVLGPCDLTITPEMAERIADIYICDYDDDDDDYSRIRSDIVAAIIKDLDRTMLKPEIVNNWLTKSCYQKYMNILIDVVIQLLLDGELVDYEIPYEQFFWDYIYRAAYLHMNRDTIGAKERLDKAILLYEQLPLPEKQKAAPERGSDNSIINRRDEDDQKYIVALLCYGRTDLARNTLVNVAYHNSRTSRLYKYLRRSLDSIYKGTLLAVYNREEVISSDAPTRLNAINRLVEGLKWVEETEGSIRNEMRRHEYESTTEKYVFDILKKEILTNDIESLSTETIDYLLRATDTDSNVVFDWPISIDWKIDRAINRIAAGKHDKETLQLLKSNSDAWPRLSNKAILGLCTSDNVETISFALDISIAPERGDGFYEQTITYAMANMDEDDQGCIKYIIERIMNEDRLKNNTNILLLCMMLTTQLDDDTFYEICRGIRKSIVE